MAPAVLSHMGWHQQELEEMRSEAKQRFHQSRQSSCVYCGSLIKCNMYRHVARFHLDVAQLWRCPVSWCTVWKGTPQDCMDHLRGAHEVSRRPACRWFTNTGFTSMVYLTSLSGRTTCCSCARCCRWPCRQLGWCLQTLPAPLSNGGGGLVGTNLSGAWCGSFGGPPYGPRR